MEVLFEFGEAGFSVAGVAAGEGVEGVPCGGEVGVGDGGDVGEEMWERWERWEREREMMRVMLRV